MLIPLSGGATGEETTGRGNSNNPAGRGVEGMREIAVGAEFCFFSFFFVFFHIHGSDITP